MSCGRNDVLRRCILRDESTGSCFERFEELFIPGIHRQHNDPEIGELCPGLACRFDAGTIGESHIEHDDLWVQQAQKLACFSGGTGLTDNIKVPFAFERTAQPLANQLVIVDDENRDCHAQSPFPEVAASARTAASALIEPSCAEPSAISITVPPPCRSRTLSATPRRCGRSRIMSKP